MKLQEIMHDFTVCKLESVPGAEYLKEFTTLSITDDEISFVCPTPLTPPNTTELEDGWKCLKICGVLDFGMVGIIAKISALLAEAKISLFVISTFNTDYVLVKEVSFAAAKDVLRAGGYEII